MIFEVKNFEGDYYIEKDQWYSASSKIEIVNPLSQLERSRSLLQDFSKILNQLFR